MAKNKAADKFERQLNQENEEPLTSFMINVARDNIRRIETKTIQIIFCVSIYI